MNSSIERLHKGSVIFYCALKGYGMIACDDFDQWVHVPAHVVSNSGAVDLVEDQVIYFKAQPSNGRHSGKYHVTQIVYHQTISPQVKPARSPQLKKSPPAALWECRAHVLDDICQISVSNSTISISNPGWFSSVTQERSIARISEIKLETGLLTDHLTLRGGGPPLTLSSSGHGDLRELFRILQNKTHP
jgi:cold shock CspA family protein